MSGKSVLVLGGTGAVGKLLIKELLQNGNFTKVTTAGRREFEYDGPNKDILVQKVVDFENLEATKDAFVGHDVVICTLGTTRAIAGSAENFVRIDKGYVVDSAKLIHRENPSRPIHYLYCSSLGANARSHFLYPRTKGEIERELGTIGFDRVTIFRPGVLKTEEPRSRSTTERWSIAVLITTMSAIGYKGWIHTTTVAKAMRRFACDNVRPKTEPTTLDSGTKFVIVENKEILEMGDKDS